MPYLPRDRKPKINYFLIFLTCYNKLTFYETIKLYEREDQLVLEIGIRARENTRAVCSGCGQRRPGYDRLPRRRFEFIPFWGILVFFVYALRRVNCPECGVKVERVPWAEGKSPVTTR